MGLLCFLLMGAGVVIAEAQVPRQESAEVETPEDPPAEPPGSFDGIAFGTTQEAVLLGRKDAKLVASDVSELTFEASYEGRVGSDQVEGVYRFHFRDERLVGGERRIRERRGRDDRWFFRRVYLELRAQIVRECPGPVVADEPGLVPHAEIEIGASPIPEEVWDGSARWTTSCAGPVVRSKVQLVNLQGPEGKPEVVLSVRPH